MSLVGHNPNLPHCNNNGRFTSISGHNRRRILPALPTYVTATLAPAKGRLIR